MVGFFFVLVDIEGFIGAFSTKEKALEVVNKYRGIPLIMKRYTLCEDEGSDPEHVWFLPYTAINHPITVSNNKTFVEQLQQKYLELGLTYKDNVTFFKRKLDEIDPFEQKRLVLTTTSTPSDTTPDLIIDEDSKIYN